ncbi:light harvesting protein subunit alpha [Rhodococcus sp. NPDC127528]|uniref:light harvesting protein subunit alpha n=1 Tax=unclassified Rhodococcus (in: high G+C Gram-positive bacteria) TaxID=192944 RepID=UPI003625E4F8
MPTSLTTSNVRRRIGVTAAGLAAVGALVAPGVAWADNAIPQGGPVVLRDAAPTATDPSITEPRCGVAAIPLSDAEVQKMIGEGTIIAAAPVVPATPGDPANPVDPAASAVPSAPTVPATPADLVAADLPAQVIEMLRLALGDTAPAGTVAATRTC